MNTPIFRLNFIDLMRAFAICMMLQGHFVDGLLANQYRDLGNPIFSIWLFFRGITAPIFFTVSGFIFMYLLAKETDVSKIGWKNNRVRKGIRRGLKLILIAYLLRTNLKGLFLMRIYPNSYMIDVLHCIGLSLLFLVAIYLFSYHRKNYVMPSILLSITLLLFLFAPIYENLDYNYLPDILANYFTKSNGSVFTIFPWFGYVSFGAFLGIVFNIYKERQMIYRHTISLTLLFGLFLSFGSNSFFSHLYHLTDWQLFGLQSHCHIFNRLGNVLLSFAIFISIRNLITFPLVRSIGQNTLSIYIIHYIILYGSLTGIGLYRYWHHSLSPSVVSIGAFLFVIINILLSFILNKVKINFAQKSIFVKKEINLFLIESYRIVSLQLNRLKSKMLLLIHRR